MAEIDRNFKEYDVVKLNDGTVLIYEIGEGIRKGHARISRFDLGIGQDFGSKIVLISDCYTDENISHKLNNEFMCGR